MNQLSKESLETMRWLVSGSSLFRNNGDGTFHDVAKASKTNRTGWAWGNVPADYDADGWPDVYVVNGFVTGATDVDL